MLRKYIPHLFLVLVYGVVLGGLFLLASKAKAGEAYCWTTQDHVFACTDSLSMVPAGYEASVVTMEPLQDYPRLTISDPAPPPHAWQPDLSFRSDPWPDPIALPTHAVREMRYIENHLGYSGRRYVAVDVLYDADGNELTWAVSEIGLTPAALIQAGPPQ
jgi:hypothetical protein